MSDFTTAFLKYYLTNPLIIINISFRFNISNFLQANYWLVWGTLD